MIITSIDYCLEGGIASEYAGVNIMLGRLTSITSGITSGSNDKARLSAIHKSHAVIEFTPDGIIKEANESFLKLMGYERSEIVGKHVSYVALKPELVQMYKSNFTAQEINAISDFYESPAGQKALQKLPEIMQQSAQLGFAKVQQNLPELQSMIAQEAARLAEVDNSSQ
jgi:PAS domain-containing protein